jgi:D-arabinose 1-dehydrogenase-like Zn-dependent alcohol dehydrogenase
LHIVINLSASFTMQTHRALVLYDLDEVPSFETIPKPSADKGEVLVQILATPVLPYSTDSFNGRYDHLPTLPLIPGNGAVGRVEEIGPDAVSLVKGDLVLCTPMIQARDNPEVSILLGSQGGIDKRLRELVERPWKNGSYAEFSVFPLENVFSLGEHVLMKEMEYSMEDICWILKCLIPYAGLYDMGVRPGDVVIVAPATGRLGGAAVSVALAMGLAVVAVGRDGEKLERLRKVFGEDFVRTVVLSGEQGRDSGSIRMRTPRGKGADAYIDLSPEEASKSTHVEAALSCLRSGGRAMFMGGVRSTAMIPYGVFTLDNLKITGRFGFERRHVLQMIKMVETGILKLGEGAWVKSVGFGLEYVDRAIALAVETSGRENHVFLVP